MAERPWITPDEVLEYTEYSSVKQRDVEKIKVDIARAEKYICDYCNRNFEDIPDEKMEPVKIAAILVAEAIAYNAMLRVDAGASSAAGRRIKSETFDDYSYTVASVSEEEIKLSSLDIGPLLDDYIVRKPTSAVTMRLRRL